MYLLCAKSPQGPSAPGESPLFKTKIDALPLESKIIKLRTDVAKLLEMELDSFNLLYCGRILDDEKTIESYNIKATSSVHVIPKAPKQHLQDIEDKRAITDEELQQFMIAFGMAVKNPAFNRVAQGLAKRENLESLIAANPSLAKDPIACGFLSKPELLLSLLDPETYKYVYERHPGLAEAAHQLAATVHEEKPSTSTGGDASGPANPFAYNLDEMSDDDEDEDEDMDVGPVHRQNSLSGITSDQLAASLRSVFGGMTGMGLMGGNPGAQGSSSNPQPSSSNPTPSGSGQSGGTGWMLSINSRTGETTDTDFPIPSTPGGITQDQLAAALQAAASNLLSSPASSNSNQGIGGNLFFSGQTQSSMPATQEATPGSVPQQPTEQHSNTGIESQIATIREITGMDNTDLASRALQLMGGDVQAAIDLILSGWLGQDDTAN